MSDLAKSFAATKFVPPPPASALSEDPESHYVSDSSSASSMSSTGTLRPTTGQTPSGPSITWNDYFTQELYLEHIFDNKSRAKYHVYVTPPDTIKAPLFVLHHGAGSSGMSLALFARELKMLLPDAGIISLEAREHGSVVYDAEGNVNSDLSIDVLSSDMVSMLKLTSAKLGWPELPTMLLVGHSLGGAVVTETAKSGVLGDRVLGYAVLDVVEGSAMDALKSMQSYLSARPKSFPTVDAAIDWHIRSRTLRNLASARASVPPLLMMIPSGVWVWKTDLSRTEAYWENWFSGMSSKFLTAKGAKLLMLAGTDRLDRELMIGQMQGKFQLYVFPTAGHFLQEDLPEKTAEAIAEFFRRNDRNTLVLPPKVSDLIAQGKKV
ncbi:protein phosphatase methylesteras-like protein 1 [Pseudovirgaria hyperparasitica]|uniref:Protein phosphatase methylesterase 1 n=1 Tax=Pseudovirgaria hyperparasitica TaxID=470096 RepID=A0A6A6VRF0_9PEZI|nr:protein phosphatase methylesteras-like protein 1 [Pseudovirgaria hyperparasitica]KAF2753258.1 protein phosphatase methylesteras-like protein 1 [Pseudovirgaria hyperparasitica]